MQNKKWTKFLESEVNPNFIIQHCLSGGNSKSVISRQNDRTNTFKSYSLLLALYSVNSKNNYVKR